MTKMKVRYEFGEDGWWLARVPSVKGCHTQGRTLGAARRRIKEAVEVALDRDVSDDELEHVDPKLPSSASKVVFITWKARVKADLAQAEAQTALRSAALELTEAGFSLRDTGDLLGVSFQRVQQIRKDAAVLLTNKPGRSKTGARNAARNKLKEEEAVRRGDRLLD